MRIVVSGATGLIGSALVPRLRLAGHDVRPLKRPNDWDPEAGRIDRAVFQGTDTVIHLAGENVFGRWTEAKQRRIRDSRVNGTRLVSEAIAASQRPPRVLLAASAIGYYGDRGDEELTEQSPPGIDFLARVSQEWEAATAPAARAGARVVHLRFGVVMSPAGGALAKMLPPFRIGLGGHVGNGQQYLSWIALEDALNAITRVLDDDAFSGPVNIAGPHPVTNREFAKTLGRVLGRPAIVPVPAFALRVAFGAEAADMLTTGQRVRPARLLSAGFRFRYPEAEPALRSLLAAPSAAS